MKRLVIFALAVALTGCAALKQIGSEFAAPFREDPARAALLAVKEAVIDVRVEVFIPLCDTPDKPPVGGDVTLCDTWKTQVDPAIVAAHDKAVAVLEITENDTTRIDLAADVIALAVRSLDDMIRLDDHVARRDVYRRVRLTLSALLAGLAAQGVH